MVVLKCQDNQTSDITFSAPDELERASAFLTDAIIDLDSLNLDRTSCKLTFSVKIKDSLLKPKFKRACRILQWKFIWMRIWEVEIDSASAIALIYSKGASRSNEQDISIIELSTSDILCIYTYESLAIRVSIDRLKGRLHRTNVVKASLSPGIPILNFRYLWAFVNSCVARAAG